MSKKPLERILAPVDLSSCSRSALKFALSIAEAYGAEVEVLFVREDDGPERIGLPEARKGLHDFVLASLGSAHLTPTERVEPGDPREQILAVAKAGNFDAIVLGTHGRTGRARSLAGSVAEQTVRTAHCPVITVREP
jgi:nucleotide-binding universal stress UspA family protein